jgi:pimeloyl-ACP methyl ester carboxylesterase
MIRVFADDRIEDHLIADQALLDDPRRQRCGHYAAFFAGLACTLLAPGHQHEILHRLNIQLLALFVADHRCRLPTATAHALFGRAGNHALHARKIRRQRLGAIKKTSDGFTYFDPAQFHELFAADLPGDQAAFMARSQVFNLADNFSATITTAAWRTKPSWMVVAGSDRTINPDLERWYAKRAKSHTVEVAGASHSVYVSHSKEVADVIESAARAVAK